ncbi:MAG: murein hydrolase activator EnvC family protein [Minisyncoccia bacterium]
MSSRSPLRGSCAVLAAGIIAGSGFGMLGLLAFAPSVSNADSTSSMQSQIESTNSQINELQNEIAHLQSELNTASKKQQTLQSAVNQLNLNIKQKNDSIALTQEQIKQKDEQISELSGTIATTTSAVGVEEDGTASALRSINELENEPPILTLLSGGTLSDFFNQAIALQDVQGALEQHITDLSNLKDSLTTTKDETEAARAQLAALQTSLTSQKQGLVTAKAAQSELLSETKDKESNYQSLITQKKSEEQQFEQQLSQYQDQLKGVSASGVPASAPVLSWPLAGVYPSACPAPKGYTSCITQYFGNTPFATQNPQVYNGSNGHDGVDLAASPGTPVMAAADGVVRGTGNTDITVPDGSFGKWIFIDHSDGLSTMYAHLGEIDVTKGQHVTRGQVIGYSDTTGYATGPHLHFGVYVSSATVIKQLPTAKRQLIIPIAPPSGYLNPLSYLPMNK